MLTRSIFVRRLIPSNPDEYAKDPEAYTGTWEPNPDGEVGEAVSDTWMPVPDPQNPNVAKMVPMLGVCWFDTRTPAMSWESPAYLENVDEEMAEDDDEEGDQDPEKRDRD